MIAGRFHKVSEEQYVKDMVDTGFSEIFARMVYADIELPTRATKGSAGYDFKAPYTFEIGAGETIKIPTGIQAEINSGWFLMCVPRSGLGFKYRMQLDNTLGIIDSDYIMSDNEGHIFVKITNDSKTDKVLKVEKGKGFVQGIFLPYGLTYGDDADGERNGGFGSTDK